ncbi:putative metal-binding protein [Alkalispirillum mobile]|uniref:Putative metal-binding protein n=1 Tax=Alkalispirillum mobile TaxID=85925 RepID=A0A498CEQ2_9GAMM|nr:putative zinc-binding protein [Alkalispirillum mobile]RLK50791.1 putative metal-binding protein [Alkalispirillum mobile]
MSRFTNEKPLVYSCSGCSSVAQLANHLALRLQSEGVAEMSCIAGVGGDVPSLVKKAKSGRPILALDGCQLQCVRHSLARHGIQPTWHELLTDHGVRKQYRKPWSEAAADKIFPQLVGQLQSDAKGGAGSPVAHGHDR